MRKIMTRDGVAEHYGEGEDIPQRYVQADRDRARRELAASLRQREKLSEAEAADWARRVVVPDRRLTIQAIDERARIAAGPHPSRSASAREMVARINERRAKARAQGSDDGMEASA